MGFCGFAVFDKKCGLPQKNANPPMKKLRFTAKKTELILCGKPFQKNFLKRFTAENLFVFFLQ